MSIDTIKIFWKWEWLNTNWWKDFILKFNNKDYFLPPYSIFFKKVIWKYIPMPIVHASFWHWLSCVSRPVYPSILDQVILLRFIPVLVKLWCWVFSFALFIFCLYIAKEPITGLSFVKELMEKLKNWTLCKLMDW